MKRLFSPIFILVPSIFLISCYSTEEYFVGAPPDLTASEKNVQLVNDHYKIHSTVFYRNFQETLGVSSSGTLEYDHIKVKSNGSLYVMGSKQNNATATAERFEFQTDDNLSNLSTVSSLTSVSESLKENYYAGPSDDYIYLNYYYDNDIYYVDVSKNGSDKGTVRDFYGVHYQSFPTVWHLDDNDNLYNLEAGSFSDDGDGIARISKLNTQKSEYWEFNPEPGLFSRIPAFMQGNTPYWFRINAQNNDMEIYKGNSSIVFEDPSNIQYGYDLVQTSDCDCYFFGYKWVSDGLDTYILGSSSNEFGLIKFNSQTNNANLVAQFSANFTRLDVPDADVMVKLLRTGVAYIMVKGGYGDNEDGSIDYELYKVSEAESKSYGVINTKDFDSSVTYNYLDFYIINDKPVIWFNSGSGVDYSDQLLVVTPK